MPIVGSPYRKKKSHASWYSIWTSMWYFMWGVSSASCRPWGISCSRSGVGFSVASASAARESMMRFTHRSCSTVRGVPRPVTAATKATVSATRLTVSWNWRNLRMLPKMQRPHSTALTMEPKLSSRMTMSDASLATSVPQMPIASPTSASFRAGASLVPSPVTATTSPCRRSNDTRRCLSAGWLRARTCSWGSIGRSCSSLMPRKVGPSMTMPSSWSRLHSRAMCCAVYRLSPVTILTAMPAALQTFTVSGTPARTGSLMPRTATRVRPSSSCAMSPVPRQAVPMSSSTSREATARVRSPREAMLVMSSSSSVRSAGVSSACCPASVRVPLHRARIISAAPFTWSVYAGLAAAPAWEPLSRSSTLPRLRSEEKVATAATSASSRSCW
mmetsp:Transcript_23162/g.59346  ORF Transcript_23162/g.59346 Transcript_23162/m.59346 type:complete len:387 (+) Transcript_23162:1106-2266(+)